VEDAPLCSLPAHRRCRMRGSDKLATFKRKQIRLMAKKGRQPPMSFSRCVRLTHVGGLSDHLGTAHGEQK
jgi:hypothetical protein